MPRQAKVGSYIGWRADRCDRSTPVRADEVVLYAAGQEEEALVFQPKLCRRGLQRGDLTSWLNCMGDRG
jgi:hypothetical protein